MDLDDKVCYCFHVSKRKLVNFVKRERPRVPSQLSQCGGAGTGRRDTAAGALIRPLAVDPFCPWPYKPRRLRRCAAAKGRPCFQPLDRTSPTT